MDLMVSRSRASVCKRGALSPDEDFMMLAFPFQNSFARHFSSRPPAGSSLVAPFLFVISHQAGRLLRDGGGGGDGLRCAFTPLMSWCTMRAAAV